MELINSKILQSFVEENKKEMEGLFPELVKRLIISSCKRISSIRMPSGDDIWAPGFDGQLTCEEQTTYVNSGNSVWEFGTNADSLKKIEADFAKRNQSPLGVEKKETSFYLVVPYVWAYNNQGIAISQWETEHKGDWKTVKVYDAPIICDWINSEPTVCAWLFDRIKKEDFHDFSTVASAWEKLSNYTNPPFSSCMFLSERDAEVDLFYERVNTPICVVKADTFVGARGFVLSALMQNEKLAQTCLVVNNEKTYKSISSTVKNKIIFLNYHFTGEVLPGNNCILCINREGMRYDGEIELPMLTKGAYKKALTDMKIPSGMCEELFAFTHGNLRTLIRRIPGLYIEEKPDWEKVEEKDGLIPLVFMRALNRKEDAGFAESITGIAFSEIEKQYMTLLKLEDSPVKKVNESYVIVNFEEAWEVLNLSESEYYFEKLTDAIYEMHGLVSNGDTIMRNRALERKMSALLLNYIYFSSCIPYEMMCQTISHLLAKLYDGSMSRILLENMSILAEACPKAVLDFFSEDVKKEEGVVMTCFAEPKYNTSYCHILRALEELMLVKETIVGAFKILVFLYDLKREYSISNKPEDSILSSLCLWRTEGTSSLELKRGLILSLLEKKEVCYASLAIKLVTQDSYFIGVRLGERRVQSDPVSPDELISVRDEIMDKAIGIAFDSFKGDLIKEMLDKFFFVSPEKLLEYAERFEKDSFDKESIQKINYWAREKLFSIQRFKWEEYEAYIRPIEIWIERTTDSDDIEASFWIFKSSYNCPALELLSSCEDFRIEDKARWEFQREKFANLLKKYGRDVLVKLITYMDDNSNWGRLIAAETDENDFDYYVQIIVSEGKRQILCEYLDCSNVLKAGAFILSCEEDERHALLSGMSNNEILPELKEEEDIRAYWKNKQMFQYDEKEYSSLLKYYPANLLFYLSVNIGKNPEQFVDMTEEVFSAIVDGEEISLNRNQTEDVEQIMKAIDAVFYSEDWALLCIEMYVRKYTFLLSEATRRYMFEHPLEIKKLLEESDLNRFRVIEALELPNCAYSDYSNFRYFILQLQELLNDEKWYYIGHILGKAIPGMDGWFPHEFIRNILEEIDNTDLDLHVMVAYQNNKSFRVVSDGSDQRANMEKYRNKSIELGICYPHTANILRMISEEYEMNARRDYESSEIDLF